MDRQQADDARPGNGASSDLHLDERALLAALLAARGGDFSVRMPVGMPGTAGRIYAAYNEVVSLNERMTHELSRTGQVVGKQGRLKHRASLGGHAGGAWAVSIDAVNELIADLAYPTAEVTRVIGAVASGDLSQTMELESESGPLQGEFLRKAQLVNKMVHQLGSFASEVTRVAREVGTEGKLGGQAQVRGVAGRGRI